MDQRPPDQQFEPHQSSLRREPRTCPRCGEPLPAEPDILTPDERVHDPNRPEVRWAAQRQRVEIFGGDTGFSEADPFAIEAERVSTAEDVARWMAEIASRPWGRRRDYLDQLANSLCTARTHEGAVHPSE